MPADNVTWTGFFPALAASSGLPLPLLWIGFLTMLLMPGIALRLPKMFYPLTFLGGTLFGVYLGILPSWMLILACGFASLFFLSEGFKLFRGEIGPLEPISDRYQAVTGVWLNNLYQREQARAPEVHSWNCKNCGGPNLNRTNCQWCGMVDEK